MASPLWRHTQLTHLQVTLDGAGEMPRIPCARSTSPRRWRRCPPVVISMPLKSKSNQHSTRAAAQSSVGARPPTPARAARKNTEPRRMNRPQAGSLSERRTGSLSRRRAHPVGELSTSPVVRLSIATGQLPQSTGDPRVRTMTGVRMDLRGHRASRLTYAGRRDHRRTLWPT